MIGRATRQALTCLLCWATMSSVFGTVTFHSGALDSVAFYSPPITSFIGPQPGDATDSITGSVVLYNGDPCDADAAAAMTFSGKIVLVNADEIASASCSYETGFTNLQSRGAAGILVPNLHQVPGMTMFSHDGSNGARTRSSRTMCLQIQPTADEYEAMVAMAPNLNATIFPDVNVWGDMFSSWRYQVFVRILPSAILIGSGLLAAVFLVQHAALMHVRFTDTVAADRRTFRRRLRFFLSTADLPFVALHIEAVSATLAGAILAIGGYLGSAVLTGSVVGFFATLLTGWSLVCSLLCARFWTNKLADITPGRRPALITRIIQGDYWSATVALYLLPIVLDTSFSVCLALNYDLPVVLLGGPIGTVLVQAVISSNVIVGAIRYHRTVQGIHGAVGAAVHPDTAVDSLMKRLNRCAVGLAVSMMVSSSGTVLLGLLPSFAYTPDGFTLAIALFYNGRAMDSAFRVLMLQPRRRDSVADPRSGERWFKQTILVQLAPKSTTLTSPS